MNLGGYACSMMCERDWFNRVCTSQCALDHFGRIHEPKRTDASGAWYKQGSYNYNSNNQHYFVNDLLGERRPITQAQYNDEELTQPS